MSGVMAAELTKLRTLPAFWFAAGAALVANTVLGALAASDVVRIGGRNGSVVIGRLGTLMLAPGYLLAAVAVLAAGSEYSGGQLRVSLLAVPARGRLFASKLSVAAAASLMGAVVVLLPGHLLQHGDAAQLLALVTAYLLLGVVGFGLAVLTRTVVTPLALLFAAAVLIAPTLRTALPEVVRRLPHDAALSLVGMADDPGALTRLGGLSVLAAWSVVTLAVAASVYIRRDS